MMNNHLGTKGVLFTIYFSLYTTRKNWFLFRHDKFNTFGSKNLRIESFLFIIIIFH